MKKIIIMMVVALMATTNVSAQNAFEPKHDIAISVGAWSNSDIINVFEDMLTIMLTGSCGLASSSGATTKPGDLLKMAEKALKLARKRGGNQIA